MKNGKSATSTLLFPLQIEIGMIVCKQQTFIDCKILLTGMLSTLYSIPKHCQTFLPWSLISYLIVSLRQ